MWRAFCVVALCSMALLLARAVRVGIADDYVDPTSKITAQDEALYSHSAIRMALRGDWATPYFMGRYGLYKPPLLIWIAAFSVKVLGVSRVALRLPSIVLCSLALGLVFLWGAEMRSWETGAVAVVLTMSNHLWHVLASSCMTDGPLVTCYIVAAYCLFADPWFESKWALWGFAGAVAGAILDKSVAGVLPLGVLGIYWLVARRREKASFGRLCLVIGLSLALAAPWFLWEFAMHRRWFWTEHILVEIFGFGTGKPPQTSQENQAMFYLQRLPMIDPMLLAAAAIGLPGLLKALWKRTPAAIVLAAWIAVIFGAVFLWQYRNLSYVLPVFPAMALVAAIFGPFQGRVARWALIVAGIILVVKTQRPDFDWGLTFAGGKAVPAEASLSGYCEMKRTNEIVMVDFEDALYATVLPLPRVHYAVVAGSVAAGKYGMPFEKMGIAMDAAEFNDLAKWLPIYRDRLREWGLDSDEPVATLIVAHSNEELAGLVKRHPETDFFMPEHYRGIVAGAAPEDHVLVDAGRYFFLLARQTRPRAETPWACQM